MPEFHFQEKLVGVSAPFTNVKELTDHPSYVALGFHRMPVPEDKISWDVDWFEYDLAEQKRFDHPAVVNEFSKNGEAGWAASPSARALVVETRSYVKDLPSNSEGEVLNPGGRTGIKDGRGLLGKPGPNFAADPMIFRQNPNSGELEILLIQRKDTLEWALPGGMTDYGELASQTLYRELKEETGFALSMDDATVVYAGYVDDPRNTDKAWMETIAAVKLLTAEEASRPTLKAGDDAKAAQWKKVDAQQLANLYASHAHLVRLGLEHLANNYSAELEAVSSQLVEAREIMAG